MGRKKGRKGKQGGESRWSVLTQSFLLGEPLDEDTAARVRELAGLLMIGLALWLLLCLFSFHMPFDAPGSGHNLGGRVGFFLAQFTMTFMGYAAFLLAVLALSWGFVVVARKEVDLPMIRVLGALIFTISFAFILDLAFVGQEARDLMDLGNLSPLTASAPYGPGGWLAHEMVPILESRFGSPGLWVVLITLALVSFMLATEMAFYPAYVAFTDWVEDARERRGESIWAATGRWSKELFAGLWDFLRGADLKDLPKKAIAKSKAKAASKSRAKAKASTEEEEDEEEYEDEDEEEYEDDEEYEDEEDEEEEDEEEEDEEEEEEDEDEDDEEWEDEEEEEEDEEDEEEYEDEEELEDTEVVAKGSSKKARKKVAKAPAKKAAKKAAKKTTKKVPKARPGVLTKLATAAANKARQTTFAEPTYNPPTPPTGPWKLRLLISSSPPVRPEASTANSSRIAHRTWKTPSKASA